MRAKLSSPSAVAVDGAGNILIADFGNQRIRMVANRNGTFYKQSMQAGNIYTIAGGAGDGFSGDGGPATSAKMTSPRSVAVDAAGNLLITDTYNNRIPVVAAKAGTFYGMTAGDIYTIAGDGTLGYSGGGGPAGLGDSGPGTAAQVNLPTGIAVDAHGNVLISDYSDSRVRLLAASTGTFYGQVMTAGDIYTVAGSGAGTAGAYGTAGFTGDGGSGTKAEVNSPMGVAEDGTGLVFADSQNNRIRTVSG